MYKGLKQKLDMRVFCMNKVLLFAMVLDMLYLVAFACVCAYMCIYGFT
ncbi:hypothetical protein [Helicobacter trogontum]|nr:hypothetical protein [Helicobacter trogontum]MDY5185338.1 hypothetical protein [Helicobacter trogontum]